MKHGKFFYLIAFILMINVLILDGNGNSSVENLITPIQAMTSTQKTTDNLISNSECGNFDDNVIYHVTRVQAYKIKEAIEQGCNIKAEDVIIEGDLSLLAKNISDKVDFKDAIFESLTEFDGSNFEKEADFTFSTFKDQTTFSFGAFSTLNTLKS